MTTKNPDLFNQNNFLAGLPLRRQSFLASKMVRVEFTPGAHIIQQGQPGHFLGFIERGQVLQENGKTRSRVLTAGDHFGSEMLRFGKDSSYTLTAQTRTTLLILNRADWLTPSSSLKSRASTFRLPELSRSAMISLLAVIISAMVIMILGPNLLDHANNTLPEQFLDRGRPDLAERYLQFAIGLEPESARLYGDLADILISQSKNQEAIEAYQEALKLDEYLPWIHNNLGVLLLEQDFYALAAEHFQLALELDPENTAVYQNLGNAYYAQDQWKATANAYQKALELDFTLLNTKAAWAGLILYEHRMVEARLVWEDVLITDPRHPLALQGLGVVSLLEGDPALAMMYFDAANYLDPDDPTLHLYTGMALKELDRPQEAAKEFQLILTLDAEPELEELAAVLLEVVLE